MRGRLRILFLIDFAVAIGGAERFAVGLATRLPSDRFERWLCSTRSFDDATVRVLEDAGVAHVNLGRRSKLGVHRLAGLASLLRRERFDILHTHKFGSNLWGSVIGRACGVPILVTHEHTWSYEGQPLRVWLDRWVIGQLATKLVAVSEANRDRMIGIEGISPEKVVVLPTGYVPHARANGADIRAELGLEADAPLIGTAAGLRVEKALDVLVAAHGRVLARLPNAHLVLAGDGECRADLERQADQLGISDKVHFLGERTDVDQLLAAFDLAALSSDWEGQPLFAYECMANGTPLVATAVGGLPDIVEDGRTGLLVPSRDPAALAAALSELLLDPDRRRRLGAAAKQRAGEFTIDVVAARFADLYETLAAERRA